MTQKSLCTPSHNFVELYRRNKARIDNRKKPVKQQYLLHSPHVLIIMANFGPLAAEIGSGVAAPQKNSTGLALASLLQRRRSSEANQASKLCTIFDRLLRWYTIYTFSGALAP